MAAQDYDSQLLESVAVRRRRIRDAVLFGGERQRRSVDERMGKVFAGIVIAAVLGAGCVGWSFVAHRVMKEKPGGGAPSVTRSSTDGVSESPSPAPSSR
ncbi:hypothetical protein [Streptomyces sp. NPDC059063]|uniref:hypothetical protein n=1 Tax=unclassified Streptomyces TaxID=2593676 RepID=UPI0036B17C04